MDGGKLTVVCRKRTICRGSEVSITDSLSWMLNRASWARHRGSAADAVELMHIRRSGHPGVSLSTLMVAFVLCLSCSMLHPPCRCHA